MPITRGVLVQSPEPEAHDKVLDSNPDRFGIWKCWFLRRGENRNTRRKTSRIKDENQQQTQPTYDAESGNRTRATLVRGECSHHCAIPAPMVGSGKKKIAMPANNKGGKHSASGKKREETRERMRLLPPASSPSFAGIAIFFARLLANWTARTSSTAGCYFTGRSTSFSFRDLLFLRPVDGKRREPGNEVTGPFIFGWLPPPLASRPIPFFIQ